MNDDNLRRYLSVGYEDTNIVYNVYITYINVMQPKNVNNAHVLIPYMAVSLNVQQDIAKTL